LQFEGTTGRPSCIRICIVDVKVQMHMRMQGEWPCPKHSNLCMHLYELYCNIYKVETPIHDNDLILTPIIAPQSG
jgi:hypothetical protein